MASSNSEIEATELESHAVDALVRDACESQREHGVIPQPDDVRHWVSGIVERLDQKPQIATPTTSPSTDEDYRKEFERRGGRPDVYPDLSIERRGITPADTVQVTRDRGAQLIARRLRLMRSKPDWWQVLMIRPAWVKHLKPGDDPLKTINPLAISGALGIEKKREACRYMWTLITDSCAVFGPLHAEQPKPLWFTP